MTAVFLTLAKRNHLVSTLEIRGNGIEMVLVCQFVSAFQSVECTLERPAIDRHETVMDLRLS
jgi:hypothetical protein